MSEEPQNKAAGIISNLSSALGKLGKQELDKRIKKTNAIFELQVTRPSGDPETWTIDMKKSGKIDKSKGEGKPDVIITLSEQTLADLAANKINGQKAYMTGKLKAKGSLMAATKLGDLLSLAGPKAKL